MRLVIEKGIAELRVRRSVTGKLVMQVRCHLQRQVLTMPPELKLEWEYVGLGGWRDANGNDATETTAIMNKLSSYTLGE